MAIGIGEIIFTIIIAVVIGYTIYRFKVVYDKKKRESGVREKIEKQNTSPMNIGGKKYPIDSVDMSGPKEVKKEVKKEKKKISKKKGAKNKK